MINTLFNMLLTLYKKYRISFKIIKITAHILSVYIWIYIKKSINCKVRSIYTLFTINTMKNINLYEEIMNWDKKPDQLYTIFRNYFADEKMSVLNTKYHLLKTKFTEKIIIYIIKNKKIYIPYGVQYMRSGYIRWLVLFS